MPCLLGLFSSGSSFVVVRLGGDRDGDGLSSPAGLVGESGGCICLVFAELAAVAFVSIPFSLVLFVSGFSSSGWFQRWRRRWRQTAANLRGRPGDRRMRRLFLWRLGPRRGRPPGRPSRGRKRTS
ncbi:hypothetical protein BRADI_5g13455v3 [Brachypodium distachyon]|uniref:Uncharacterized protein n=1 Tax=Brachypodium distachyon TaxID=15368 RepID=A0A2K2CGY2_BRADI|nr:hypothetical protein BRADI_5g13455v3 [Brachypodium distachyon]PNT61304.1 hypothetical protein BRADI_5g13455v3 [Brachypodium distachyon]